MNILVNILVYCGKINKQINKEKISASDKEIEESRKMEEGMTKLPNKTFLYASR
jgi:hypothetical protein